MSDEVDVQSMRLEGGGEGDGSQPWERVETQTTAGMRRGY